MNRSARNCYDSARRNIDTDVMLFVPLAITYLGRIDFQHSVILPIQTRGSQKNHHHHQHQKNIRERRNVDLRKHAITAGVSSGSDSVAAYAGIASVCA